MMSRSTISTPRTSTIFSNISCSRHMLNFLRERDGCEVLQQLEETLHVDFRLGVDGLTVHHEHSLPAALIENTLKQKWHDSAMLRAMKVTLLQQACAHSQCDRLTVAQAALVSLFSHWIVRESGIFDIIVETSGNVSWYGPLDSVNVARSIMDRLFREHGVAVAGGAVSMDAQTRRQQYVDPRCNVIGGSDLLNKQPQQSIRSTASFSGISVGDQHSWSGSSSPYYSNSLTTVNNNNIYSYNTNYDQQSITQTSPSISSHSRGSLSAARRKERLLFNVRSTDAPRLIGTRGINKKRIEDTTGCSITLHTESKKDGEFPVEVIGASLRQVQQAKIYIETFLANGGLAVQEEEKKIRERPKVHLVFSPKKLMTPTPKMDLSSEDY